MILIIYTKCTRYKATIQFKQDENTMFSAAFIRNLDVISE